MRVVVGDETMREGMLELVWCGCACIVVLVRVVVGIAVVDIVVGDVDVGHVAGVDGAAADVAPACAIHSASLDIQVLETCGAVSARLPAACVLAHSFSGNAGV